MAGGVLLAVGAGLSPRVRGNLSGEAVSASRAGSIPACAGEPIPDAVRQVIGEVYPRVCGGTPPSKPRMISDSGLSPRVRGNRLF